jgi:hypothetical protein
MKRCLTSESSTEIGGGLTKFANPAGLLDGDHIDDWPDLAKLLNFFSENNWHDWLFRGITNQDHPLTPGIGRANARKIKPTAPGMRIAYSRDDEIAAFEYFIDAARPYISHAPSSNVEWLAVAQHYGMPTRLLDWTEGLLIAVWFALQKVEATVSIDLARMKKSVTPINPAIWVVRGVKRVTDDERKVPFEIQEPRAFRPPHISPRISAQRSVFTIHGDPTTEFRVPEMWKFSISAKRFLKFKKRIDACGINERTLFPDLVGVARDIGWRYKNNWLAGYRN